jgi:hypothetical protein
VGILALENTQIFLKKLTAIDFDFKGYLAGCPDLDDRIKIRLK